MAERLELYVAGDALQVLPNLKAWAVFVSNLDRCGEILPADHSDANLDLDLDRLADHDRIAPWRAAYRSMGLRPSEFRSSVEQLVRRVLRGEPAKVGLWPVDLYNRLSVEHLVPIGAYDLGELSNAPLVIRQLTPGDSFEPLGGQSEKMAIRPQVLGYAQQNTILCWALNHRDARNTALRNTTRKAVFVSEAVDAAGARASQQALGALVASLADLGGTCSQIVEFEAQ